MFTTSVSIYALTTIQNGIQPMCEFESDFESLAKTQPPSLCCTGSQWGFVN